MNHINRRKFLSMATQGSGLLAISLWLPAEAAAGRRTVNDDGVVDGLKPETASERNFQSLYVTIHSDNRISFNLSKQEMGQGIATGYAMIFADELGADLESMEVISADYNPEYTVSMQGITGGSASVSTAWQPLREAAAEIRHRLIAAAGRFWNESPEGYTTTESHVLRPEGDRVAFGSLIPHIRVDDQVTPHLRPASEYKYVGRSLPNIRTREITSGRLKYGIDTRLPDMLYASIERCPVFLGKLAKVDDSAAWGVSGVVEVIKMEGFRRDAASPNLSPSCLYTIQEGVAVVATNSWAAMQGRKSLKLEWAYGKHKGASDRTVADKLSAAASMEGRTLLQSGRPYSAQPGDRQLKMSYEITFQAHALMEPLNTVCHVTDAGCEVWSGHQFAQRIVEQLSPLLQLPPEKIIVHVLPSGGGSGRRWEADFVVEAALISKRLKKPVKLTWSREDEIRHDYYHACERHLDDVVIDAAGKVTSWHSKRLTFNNAFLDDSWNPYMNGVPSHSLSIVELEAPVQVGPWRSVNPHRNTFSRECTVDRIAHALGKDPLELRLQWLREEPVPPAGEADPEAWLTEARNQRAPLIRVLEYAKRFWPAAQGAGIAITKMGSTCAHIAHVEMIKGTPKLKKVDVVVYCGRAINPSLVKGQFEGALIWGLQAVLYGGVHLRDGRVVQSNFHDYKMVRMPEVPEINIHLIESDDPPLGTGEPGVPSLAPAMANAIYSLTGRQPTNIPFNWSIA